MPATVASYSKPSVSLPTATASAQLMRLTHGHFPHVLVRVLPACVTAQSARPAKHGSPLCCLSGVGIPAERARAMMSHQRAPSRRTTVPACWDVQRSVKQHCLLGAGSTCCSAEACTAFDQQASNPTRSLSTDQ